jgi:hypothetical protein
MGHYDRWENQFWGGRELISSPEWLSMATGLERRVTSALGQTVACRRRLPGRRALRHSGGARGGGEGDNWRLEAAGDTEAPAEEKGGGSVPTL